VALSLSVRLKEAKISQQKRDKHWH